MELAYIAGPLFTEGDRMLLEQIAALCGRLGIKTYLPHRDGSIFDREKMESSKAFLSMDEQKLDEASLLIAVLNGADVDSGTSWEIGYISAANKFSQKKRPVIGYLNDTRIYEPQKQLNPMIFNSLNYLARNLGELERILRG